MDDNYDVFPPRKNKLEEGAQEDQQRGEGSLLYERESSEACVMCDENVVGSRKRDQNHN